MTAPAAEPVPSTPSDTSPSDTRSVVVGVGTDDPDGLPLTVDWAAREALARGVDLHVVSAFAWLKLPIWNNAAEDEIVRGLRRSASEAVTRAVAMAREAYPELTVTRAVVGGDTAEVLERLGEEAGLLVVGSRRLGALRRAVLGSVGSMLAANAPCPLVVLAGEPDPDTAGHSRVVVGVAADHTAEPVLDFAFAHAQRHGLPVEAMLLSRPGAYDVPGLTPPPMAAGEFLDAALDVARKRRPDVDAKAVVEVEHPVGALVEASSGQPLLVVGRHVARRQHPGLHPMSVSQRIVHHAACPVAVVPCPVG